MTYELYYDPSLAQSESNPSLARLEARIRQLEEFLGPVPLTMEAEQLDGHRGTLPLSEAIAKVSWTLCVGNVASVNMLLHHTNVSPAVFHLAHNSSNSERYCWTMPISNL